MFDRKSENEAEKINTCQEASIFTRESVQSRKCGSGSRNIDSDKVQSSLSHHPILIIHREFNDGLESLATTDGLIAVSKRRTAVQATTLNHRLAIRPNFIIPPTYIVGGERGKRDKRRGGKSIKKRWQ